jgi:prepilin-type N-terminal cleavage/methylation domain-containing protein
LAVRTGPAPLVLVRRCYRPGFSLLELIVVLAVATILTGLLLPAMNKLRENVHRVVCSSNLRQLGLGFAMYSSDYNDRLPYTVNLVEPTQPQELMAAFQPGVGFDGLGLLFSEGYCNAAACYYCPSHHGEHPLDRYSADWHDAESGYALAVPIYANYHYSGHVDWNDLERLRFWSVDAERLVLATDGLRTTSDFNHRTGMNTLHGDGSVRWRDDALTILGYLPTSEAQTDAPPSGKYSGLWQVIENPFHDEGGQ